MIILSKTFSEELTTCVSLYRRSGSVFCNPFLVVWVVSKRSLERRPKICVISTVSIFSTHSCVGLVCVDVWYPWLVEVPPSRDQETTGDWRKTIPRDETKTISVATDTQVSFSLTHVSTFTVLSRNFLSFLSVRLVLFSLTHSRLLWDSGAWEVLYPSFPDTLWSTPDSTTEKDLIS